MSDQAIQEMVSEASYHAALITAGLVAGYLVLVRALRLRRSRSTARQYSVLPHNGYDGMSTSQAQSIVNELFGLEFPWAMQNAVGFALFKVSV